MAYTKVQEIDSFADDSHVLDSSVPQYWPEDILLLINKEDPEYLVERMITFRGEEISGLMSWNTDKGNTAHKKKIVLLKCPPYARALEERFKDEE